MTHQLVVPLDMSDVAESVLPLARELASQFAAQVVLVTVMEVSPDLDDFVSTQEFKEDAARLERDMRRYLEEVAATFSGVEVETVVRMGSPLNEIAGLVEGLDRPLIVMASHGHSGFRRHVIGSVTMRTIHTVDCPVFVVRGGAVRKIHSPLCRVLVPLDGSDFAESVLDVMLGLFGRGDLDLHLVRVVDLATWRRLPFARMDYDEDARRSAATYLDRVVANLNLRGITATAEVRDGSISGQIHQTAKERQVDLIAMTTHGRSGIKRAVMGSDAESVLRETSLPLLLLPPKLRGWNTGSTPHQVM